MGNATFESKIEPKSNLICDFPVSATVAVADTGNVAFKQSNLIDSNVSLHEPGLGAVRNLEQALTGRSFVFFVGRWISFLEIDSFWKDFFFWFYDFKVCTLWQTSGACAVCYQFSLSRVRPLPFFSCEQVLSNFREHRLVFEHIDFLRLVGN